MDELLGLKDSVALVTGAGMGIGKGCALQLARAGCHVAVVDIEEDAGRQTVEAVNGLGRKAVFIKADVRDRKEVYGMVNSVREQLGGLDVAVNCVGNPTAMKPFLDYTDEEWEGNIEQNLKTAFLCCQAEAISMIKHNTKGRIINMASSSGITSAENNSAYGAANAGVIHATKTFAMELAPYGLRVNCIVPGTHLTERIKSVMESEDPGFSGIQTFLKQTAEMVPLKRLGGSEETGGLAVFLASKLSSYMTGHIVTSDGGILHTTRRPPVGMEVKPQALSEVEE